MTPPARTVPLRALGADIDVVVGGEDPAALEAAVRERWHLCLREGEPAAEPVRLEVALGTGGTPGGRREATSVVAPEEGPALTRLTHAVTGAVIRARSGELLLLHAAALADPVSGAALVAVAPGGTGKSTLCARLGRGRRYLTDETVGIRRDGTVVPFPKPVSLRVSGRAGVKDEVAPGRLGLGGAGATPWVAGIVLLRRVPDHAGPVLVEPLDTLEALASLAPESSAFMVTDRPLTWLAGLLEGTGGARRLTYGSTEDLAPVVDEVLASERPAGWSPQADRVGRGTS